MIQYHTLGRSGLLVSSLGLGCVTFGREIDRDVAFGVLDRALERGITLLDTAAAYGAGASEAIIGEWISSRRVRERIVLATKVAGTLTRKRVLESAEDSLRRLQTDHIDLFQLHNWDENTPLGETLAALVELVQAGKIRHFGCSNWEAGQLRHALDWAQEVGTDRIASTQSPYNLVQREIEPDMLPLCRERHVGVITYSPLGAGFLTGKYTRSGEVLKGTRFEIIPGHQSIYMHDRGFAVLEQLRQVAVETGISMPRLALSWVLSRPGLTSVLIGARDPAQVDQALDASAFPCNPRFDRFNHSPFASPAILV